MKARHIDDLDPDLVVDVKLVMVVLLAKGWEACEIAEFFYERRGINIGRVNCSCAGCEEDDYFMNNYDQYVDR